MSSFSIRYHCFETSLKWVIGLRVFRNITQSISPIYVSIWGSINSKYWSVFGFDRIPNTGIIWKKYGKNSLFGVIVLRVLRNTTHSISPLYASVWDSIDPKYWSVFRFDRISNTGIIWNKFGINSLFGVIGLRMFRNTMHSISTN